MNFLSATAEFTQRHQPYDVGVFLVKLTWQTVKAFAGVEDELCLFQLYRLGYYVSIGIDASSEVPPEFDPPSKGAETPLIADIHSADRLRMNSKS